MILVLFHHHHLQQELLRVIGKDGGGNEQYLSARITDDNGKCVGKMMSVEKHDYENCLRVLSDWVDLKKIEFGYGVNHGK